MILEAKLEENILSAFEQIPELSVCQFVTSRQTMNNGEVMDEEGKDAIVAINSGYRTNDSFSLSPITVPVAVVLMTRVEKDPTGQLHETLVEKIADKISYWHKFGQQMTEDLSGSKFMAGELRMTGGSGRVFDKQNKIFKDSFQFDIRGSEIFQ